MNGARYFSGSPYNVSPLCIGCPIVLFADKMGFDMHQCDKCKEAFENLNDLKEMKGVVPVNCDPHFGV